MKKRVLKFLAIYLATLFFAMNLFPPKAMAYVVGTADVASVRAEDMATIQHVIETRVVKERLKELGLTDEQIYTRLNALSDEELHSLAQNLDGLYPGGDAIGSLIGLLVLIILVLAALHLTDHRIVIEKTK